MNRQRLMHCTVIYIHTNARFPLFSHRPGQGVPSHVHLWPSNSECFLSYRLVSSLHSTSHQSKLKLVFVLIFFFSARWALLWRRRHLVYLWYGQLLLTSLSLLLSTFLPFSLLVPSIISSFCLFCPLSVLFFFCFLYSSSISQFLSSFPYPVLFSFSLSVFSLTSEILAAIIHFHWLSLPVYHP